MQYLFDITWVQFHFLALNFFFLLSIILPFCPSDILHFFIQRLRLEINFLISNLNSLNGIAPIQYPRILHEISIP